MSIIGNLFHHDEIEPADRKDYLIELVQKFKAENRFHEVDEGVCVAQGQSFGANKETQQSVDFVAIDIPAETTYSHSRVSNEGFKYDIYSFLSGKEFGYIVLDGKNIEYAITGTDNNFEEFKDNKIAKIPESKTVGGLTSLEGFAEAITAIREYQKQSLSLAK